MPTKILRKSLGIRPPYPFSNFSDPCIVLGNGAQVWYGATWIYSPEEMPIDFELQGHFMTYIRWSLNGEPLNLEDPEQDYGNDPDMYTRKLSSNTEFRKF
ncbi:hypothetical protein [Puniceicoccus vermicola]|uniref:hypothetical protein n=1 Tax=Puniceicoccus vermicola TaxID=388746 RepID=UPI001C8C7641|nr:hypothetical protein [Puniceicoccus vermicola]